MKSTVVTKCGLPSSGEFANRFIGPCVVVTIVFTDSVVMIEHRIDIELCKKGDEEETITLLENITHNTEKIEKLFSPTASHRYNCLTIHSFKW